MNAESLPTTSSGTTSIHDHSIQMDTLGHHSLEHSPEILHGPRPSEKRYDFLALHKNDYVVGIGLLLLVVLLWTLSSFLTQVRPALFHIVYHRILTTIGPV